MSAIIWPTLGIIGYFLFLRLTGPIVFTNGYLQFLFDLFKALLPLLSLRYLFSASGWLKRVGCIPLLWGVLATGVLILSSLFWPSRDLAPTIYRELDRRTIAGYEVILWVNCGGSAMGHCITELVQHAPVRKRGRQPSQPPSNWGDVVAQFHVRDRDHG